MPKFREKGLILFAESDLSSCELCADILAERSQEGGGA